MRGELLTYYVLLWDPGSDKTTYGALAEKSGPRSGSWSCGNTKGIAQGDKVILRRTGRGLKGVVGIGTVTRGSYESPWAGTGEIGVFVDIDWQKIAEEPFVDRNDPDLSGMDRFWGAQSGGTRIPDDDGATIVAKVQGHFDWSFLPTGAQFVNHWTAAPPTETQRNMLVSHYWSPERKMHPGYMSQIMGWPSASTSHLHYGKFASQTADAMKVKLPHTADKIALFAAFTRTPDGVKWVMHEQVRHAIARLGWHGEGGSLLPYELEERAQFQEGQRMQRTITVRGRNASVREHCLSFHPPICAVCSFDPTERFGAEFRNVLDVHHLNPIAESESGRTTDPEKDCRPLCPTCHRLAHHGMRAGTCRSMDELRMLLANAETR